MNLKYNEYIRSPEWKVKADAAKERAGNRCQVCNAGGDEAKLAAHHRTYERLGEELDSDITVLCDLCHKLYHFGEAADKNGNLNISCRLAFQRWGLPPGVMITDEGDRWSAYETGKQLIRKGALFYGTGFEPAWDFYDLAIRTLIEYLKV